MYNTLERVTAVQGHPRSLISVPAESAYGFLLGLVISASATEVFLAHTGAIQIRLLLLVVVATFVLTCTVLQIQ